MRVYEALILIARSERVRTAEELTTIAERQLGIRPHPGDVSMALNSVRGKLAA